MKSFLHFRSLALAAALTLCAGAASAQKGYSFEQTTYTEKNLKHDLSMNIVIKSTSSSDIKLNWILLENTLSNNSSWSVSFCDLLNCYTEIPNSGINTLPAGEEKAFGVIVDPKGANGSGVFRVAVYPEGKDDMADTLTFDITSTARISESEAPVSLQVYPNPVAEQLSIRSQDASFIPSAARVYNMLGMEIASYDLSAATNGSISVAALPKGSYFVRIAAQNGTVATRSFIKAE